MLTNVFWCVILSLEIKKLHKIDAHLKMYLISDAKETEEYIIINLKEIKKNERKLKRNNSTRSV